MSVPGNGSEPSMEEILASIRNLISQDEQQPAASAPAPMMAQPTPQRPGSEPALANAAGSDQKPLSPRSNHSSGAPARADVPTAAPPVAVRHDDDDLADLLDEPLVPVDPRPAASEASTHFVDAARPGFPGTVGKGGSSDAPTPVGAETTFDFGSLVPSRDSGARMEGNAAIPGQSRSPEAPYGTGLTSPAQQPADSLSLGWPDSMSSGPTGLSTNTSVNSDTKPATNAPAGSTGQNSGKPAVQPNPRLSEDFAAPKGAGSSFTASQKSEPSLSPAATDDPASAPHGDGQKSTAPVQSSGKPVSISGGEPSQAFASSVSRDPGVTTPTAAPSTSTDSQANFPSIEPVLKAFERSVPQSDAPVANQPDRQSPAPRTKVEFGSKPANVSPGFGLTGLSRPKSTPAPAPAVAVKAATDSTPHPGGSRTLEDAVMELLRPMLREWLDENLPRIIETAVQRDVADAIKSKVEPA